MGRFGFGSRPKIDLPRNSLRTSGVFEGGELVTDPDAPIDLGRISIGQGPLLVSPLQMAEIAAAVANGGRLMKPRLAERIVDPDGRTRDRINPSRQSRVMSSDSARKLAEMMGNVVEEGTARGVAIPGMRVAGKTGTAEVENGQDNQGWFIGFAPVEDPKIAVAVTIERIGAGGFGGETAGPVAKRVMEELLRGG
jgi:peptidoglycan glycosyltransferase